jgi:hypothetical protein
MSTYIAEFQKLCTVYKEKEVKRDDEKRTMEL